MNKIKMVAEEVGKLVEEVIEQECKLWELNEDYNEKYGSLEENFNWSESAKKDLQLGFMQLTHAVAKPTTF